MKTKVRNKRIIYATIFVCLTFAASNVLVRNTSILNFKILDPTSLLTYCGVLIGFALTVYTFGLSMIADIKKELITINDLSQDKKDIMLIKLVDGFQEIKEDIWIIFIAFILIIYFAIVLEIPNPFGWQIEYLMIPQSINLTLFIATTYSMYDIMRTLFNLSEIKLELLKYKKK